MSLIDNVVVEGGQRRYCLRELDNLTIKRLDMVRAHGFTHICVKFAKPNLKLQAEELPIIHASLSRIVWQNGGPYEKNYRPQNGGVGVHLRIPAEAENCRLPDFIRRALGGCDYSSLNVKWF